jgi:membrane protein
MDIPGFAKKRPLEVFWHAITSFLDDDMMTYAAALSFRMLLALFPFIIFLLSLLGALGLSDFFDRLAVEARQALPPGAAALVEQVIAEIRGQPREGLLSISILFALWAASTGVRSLMNAINAAYDVEETRPAWQLYPLSVVYTLGLAALSILAAGLLIIGPLVTQWFAGQIQLSQGAALFWTWLRWPLIVLLLLLVFAIIYKVAPNIDQPFRYVTPGSVVGVLAWIGASLGFSLYVQNFGNYGATYGSLGGIVVLLLYFFVSSAVLLYGAEVNAVIHPATDPRVDAPALETEGPPASSRRGQGETRPVAAIPRS